MWIILLRLAASRWSTACFFFFPMKEACHGSLSVVKIVLHFHICFFPTIQGHIFFFSILVKKWNTVGKTLKLHKLSCFHRFPSQKKIEKNQQKFSQVKIDLLEMCPFTLYKYEKLRLICLHLCSYCSLPFFQLLILATLGTY